MDAEDMEWTTVVGFGSLLSKKSALSTFKRIRNFRPAFVKGYRRVFRHSPAIFLQWGVGDMETKELSSLSCEKSDSTTLGVAVFELHNSELDDFYRREDEYDIISVDYEDFQGETGKGLFCLTGSDESMKKKFGEDYFQKEYIQRGLTTCWHWTEPIYPCRCYLRHCLLAAQKLHVDIYNSFLEDTFLWDRKTTIKTWLESNPTLIDEPAPAIVAERYNG